MDVEAAGGGRERIGVEPSTSVVFVAVGAAAGAGLALLLPVLLGWGQSLPWMPLQGPLALLDRLTAGLAGWLLLLVLGVLGALAGAVALTQCSTITVTPREIVVDQGSKHRRWARAQVHEVVLERGHLSLRDEKDVDLARESVDGSMPALATALRRQGWPVRSDPALER